MRKMEEEEKEEDKEMEGEKEEDEEMEEERRRNKYTGNQFHNLCNSTDEWEANHGQDGVPDAFVKQKSIMKTENSQVIILRVAPSRRDAGLFEPVFLPLQSADVQFQSGDFGRGFCQLSLRSRQTRLGRLKWNGNDS